MLVVVMHNNRSYLESLYRLAQEKGITGTKIVNRKGIGAHLLGGDSSLIFSRGKIVKAYSRAFIGIAENEEKAKRFIEAVEKSNFLQLLNMKDEGFICAVPFKYIRHIEPELFSGQKEAKAMNIAALFKKDRMLFDLKADTKEEAIVELSALLGNSKEVIDLDSFIKDVLEREELNTTGIGSYVAIPHARTDTVEEFVIVFGKSSKGVEFGSLDKKPAKFIFLMGTPKEKGLNDYLKILAHLTRILSKKKFQNALLEVSDFKSFIKEFENAESAGK